MKRILITLLIAGVGVGSSYSASASSQAEDVLSLANSAIRNLHSLKFEFSALEHTIVNGQNQDQEMQGSMRVMHPNLMLMNVKVGERKVTIACDGKNVWQAESGQYMKVKAPSNGSSLPVRILPFSAFFEKNLKSAAESFYNLPSGGWQYRGSELITGVKCSILTDADPQSGNHLQLDISPNNLLRRSVFYEHQDGKLALVETDNVTNLQPNFTRNASDFAYKPPSGSTDAESAASASSSSQEPDYTKNLIKTGKQVPDFSAPLVLGGVVKLADTLKNSKAVVLSFFFDT